MLHFGLPGSSLFNFLSTAAALGVAATLLWLSPWSQTDSFDEVVTQEYQHHDQQNAKQQQKLLQRHEVVASSTAYLVGQTAALTTLSLHPSATGPHTASDRRSMSAMVASTQVPDVPSATQKLEKAPRRSFSFHYLDILEWLFARKPDTTNVAQPRPTTGNLRH